MSHDPASLWIRVCHKLGAMFRVIGRGAQTVLGLLCRTKSQSALTTLRAQLPPQTRPPGTGLANRREILGTLGLWSFLGAVMAVVFFRFGFVRCRPAGWLALAPPRRLCYKII